MNRKDSADKPDLDSDDEIIIRNMVTAWASTKEFVIEIFILLSIAGLIAALIFWVCE